MPTKHHRTHPEPLPLQPLPLPPDLAQAELEVRQRAVLPFKALPRGQEVLGIVQAFGRAAADVDLVGLLEVARSPVGWTVSCWLVAEGWGDGLGLRLELGVAVPDGVARRVRLRQMLPDLGRLLNAVIPLELQTGTKARSAC